MLALLLIRFLRFQQSSVQVSFEFKHDAHMEAGIGQARTRDVKGHVTPVCNKCYDGSSEPLSI